MTTRVLGIDHGDRRIGLALSDLSRTFARPFDVVDGGETAFFEVLEEILLEHEVGHIVVGLPLNMDGTQGPKADQILAFKGRLEKHLEKCSRAPGVAEGVSVGTWDERLTTQEAERILRAGGASARKRRGRVDKVAAQILLQSYLDRSR